MLWQVERTISKVFVPYLNSQLLKDKTSNVIHVKVRKDLLPCLRSIGRLGFILFHMFAKTAVISSSLRIAEDVLKEGVLIKSFPPESYTIKCLDDAWALLDTEDGQERMEGYLKTWMKSIQDLLVESEQLRIENDKNGPQVEVEYWKTRAAKLTLLVEQIISMPCKMTLVTLRAGKCKLLKVNL